ncbi:hypothetical protein [Deinococcus sp. YIM 77859]|uniref:hypothetical protein n=1 Tax=Deinococcus sp. YIM 77859 TaxID=1540221 RepID=UPI00054DCE90|nr:hypothetical protein [Deinococcus sp. YIM 77859]
MQDVVLILEGGLQVTGTLTQAEADQVSLLAQASDVDGVMLQNARLGGEENGLLPWLYVPYARVVACGVAAHLPEDEARTHLAPVVQGIRKSLYSSRGADESVRSVENE